MKIAKPYLLAIAVSTVLALSGCSSSGGTAARVGDTTITNGDVAVMASVGCRVYQDFVKANPGQAAQQVPMKLVTYDALNTLVAAQVLQKFAEARNVSAYDAATYRQHMQTVEQQAAAAPAKDRARYLQVQDDYTKASLIFQHAAELSLGAQGADAPAEEKQKRLQKLYGEFRATLDIDINPAYSPDDAGNVGLGESSMSEPVSSFAKAAAKTSPDAKAVAALPDNQRCG